MGNIPNKQHFEIKQKIYNIEFDIRLLRFHNEYELDHLNRFEVKENISKCYNELELRKTALEIQLKSLEDLTLDEWKEIERKIDCVSSEIDDQLLNFLDFESAHYADSHEVEIEYRNFQSLTGTL